MQIACVSSTFQAAAKVVLARYGCRQILYMDSYISAPSQMNSKLMLDWFPSCIKKMALRNHMLTAANLAALLGGCQQLYMLEIECYNYLLYSTQADSVLAACPNLKILICQRWFVPNFLPSTLTALDVELSWWSQLSHSKNSPVGRLEALLWKVASAPALERLCLRLGWLPELEAHPCIQLHRLRDVRIHFSVGESVTVNLSLLHSAPMDELSLKIHLATGSVADHRQLLGQLRGLTIHHLELDVHAEVELEAQLLWAGVVVQVDFGMSIHVGTTLAALPQCGIRAVALHHGEKLAAPFSVHWSAIASCPGRIELNFHSTKVQVIGCPGYAPEFAAPRQLRTGCSAFWAALAPGSKRPGAKHLLQNQAADLAGWVSQSMWSSAHTIGWH